jgi:hypothetical protein
LGCFGEDICIVQTRCKGLNLKVVNNADMKYIAEQNRKFTDMGGVKISHAIYPIVYPPETTGWGTVIRFDNKTMQGGRQEIQNFTGSPIQIIRIVISGTAAYYDSTGYSTVLNQDDVLVVNSGNGALQSVLYNSEDGQENELLEIWLTSNTNSLNHILKTLSSHNSGLGRTKFKAGSSYDITGSKTGNSIILSIICGTVLANGNYLNYGDVAIFSLENPIHLEFEKPADVFQIEVEN